ncbi:helix-turn-helix transcriptional regulator [Flexilinea flocculi]|uniref:Bacterial regulatory proteins, luxR family n=1 Tax=Flexilinea flocculi TaxID=1678840 RepID=A0A0S7BWI0_9CHLR|nr:LuxR C-terminal-related transcriptional regulator [Flexilinea flocculi]GAP40851.1 bacterial regulatory proteins, luxR family [Flexilinea flocculi]
MPSIVVFNDEGSVLYQNVFDDVQDLVKIIRDGRNISDGTLEDCPQVRVNGLIVLTGQPPKPKREAPALSERQISVLQLLARAYTPEQIALKLGLTEATIRLHISALKKKFGTDSRDQMMAMAGQLGLCDTFETSPVHDQQEEQVRSR